MPETMKCIKIKHGELNIANRPLPIPVAGAGAGAVSIKAAAAGVNHLDVLQCIVTASNEEKCGACEALGAD